MACIDKWTWDDFYVAQAEANRLILSQHQIVDLVHHMPLPRPLPKGYYGHLLRIASGYPPNLGLVLWVGCPRPTQAMIRNVARFHENLAQRYGFLDDMDDAGKVAGV
jgi:hypothetical protein